MGKFARLKKYLHYDLKGQVFGINIIIVIVHVYVVVYFFVN